MSALSGAFLWLLPLALLPVVIHLLNRLRYRTVQWAAMMFLRSADRDASRRARIRQWLILAARCLMLLLFLLALARLQSEGKLARFFDRGTDVVVILFDRSVSMEQTRGGTGGRDRALDLVEQGLAELPGGARVLWLDSATGRITPLPGGVELDRLSMVKSTATSADMENLLRSALREIARTGEGQAEVWIPTDRQTSSWIPEGTEKPDWTEWEGLDTQVTLRLLDVSRVAPDSGNRALQVVGTPEREGNEIRVSLRLLRDTDVPESVPLRIESGGLSLREDILVEGTVFQWDQSVELPEGQKEVSALFSLPADSNPADNRASAAWRDRGPISAVVDSGDSELNRIFRAALLPSEGIRNIVEGLEQPEGDLAFRVVNRNRVMEDAVENWVREGGVVLRVPDRDELDSLAQEDEVVGVERWEEQTGVLVTEQREPLRLDLVTVSKAVPMEETEEMDVLARLEDGTPLLTRTPMGEGALYDLTTLPVNEASNLAAGFVLVPVLQRLLLEGAAANTAWSQQTVGRWDPGDTGEWIPLDGDDLNPALHAGRFRKNNRLIALNRPAMEDATDTLSVSELAEWAEPLELRVFEDEREEVDGRPAQVEFTSLLALLGLLFLAVESWLLTLNIRRRSTTSQTWRTAT